MAKDDWAIVVGISRYPALTNLLGPENDARAFFDWVRSHEGGSVPEQNARLITSEGYREDARPNAQDVESAFDQVFDIASTNLRLGRSLRVGRRLYIYLSGHGYAPSFDETALLTANASRERPRYHIPGKLYAEWFLRAGCFGEVVLFMDCGRETLFPRFPLNAPPYADIVDPTAASTGKFFCAQATKWSSHARERAIEGIVRGVFTAVLLRGLKGGACQPDGRITAASLSSYLYNTTKHFLSAEDLRNSDVPLEPEVIYQPADGNFVLVQLPAEMVPAHAVRIALPPGAIGKNVEILNDRLQVVASLPSAKSPEWKLQLLTGLYLVQVAELDRKQLFEVSGAGGVDVAL